MRRLCRRPDWVPCWQARLILLLLALAWILDRMGP